MERGEREDKLHARGTKCKIFALSYVLNFCCSWCFTLSLPDQVQTINKDHCFKHRMDTYVIISNILTAAGVLGHVEALDQNALENIEEAGDSSFNPVRPSHVMSWTK